MDKIVSSILLEYLKPVDGRFQHGLLKNYVNRMTSPHPSSGPKESNWLTSSCSDVVSGVVSRPFLAAVWQINSHMIEVLPYISHENLVDALAFHQAHNFHLV